MQPVTKKTPKGAFNNHFEFFVLRVSAFVLFKVVVKFFKLIF